MKHLKNTLNQDLSKMQDGIGNAVGSYTNRFVLFLLVIFTFLYFQSCVPNTPAPAFNYSQTRGVAQPSSGNLLQSLGAKCAETHADRVREVDSGVLLVSDSFDNRVDVPLSFLPFRSIK